MNVKGPNALPGGLPRRAFVRNSLGLAASAVWLASQTRALAAEGNSSPTKKIKIVCVGGHPDDPESGCGGILALYSQAGHSITPEHLIIQANAYIADSKEQAVAEAGPVEGA